MGNDKDARYLNIVLGIWLLISAFVWHHTRPQFTLTWITGIVIALVALSSLGAPRTRFINVVLGIWLIVSAFAFRHAAIATVWNNVIVGVIVAAVAIGAGSMSTRTSARVPS